jgi:hypothetical protein
MNTGFAFDGYAQAFRDFRGASWGMSKEEVKFSEGLDPLNEGEGFISYRERVMGLDAVVGFHFLRGSLVEAGYAFREPLGGEHAYIREYRNLKGVLTGSYGQPSYDEGSCGECGGCCVRCPGEECAETCPLVYLCEWTTPRSVIRLVLMGEGKGFDFGLLHRSSEHEVRVGKGGSRD